MYKRQIVRIKEIDLELRRLEEKYGMSYKDFYNHVEGDMSVLLEKFDADEVMDDLAKLVSLLDEKEKLLKELGKEVDLFAEMDKDWVKMSPNRKVLSERERRIREIEERINQLRQKYGMDFDEFFDATEDLREFEKLMERFDPQEILEDVSEWEDLEEELKKLKVR